MTYTGGGLKLAQWAANDAEELRAEFDRAGKTIAEKIVEEVFLVYSPQ